MKLLILSANKHLYSTQRLIEEAKELGHTVEVINPSLCFLNIATGAPMVHYKKRKLQNIDAIIPRIGASSGVYGVSVVRQFEMMGKYCLNSSNAIGRARDKLRSLQLLSSKGIPLPKTSIANNTLQSKTLIELVGGAPNVVKLIEGTQGKGVVLAETENATESLIDAFSELKANFLVQEFIKDANGEDLRCFVVGEKIVGSMKRVAKEGEFRANIHRGATASKVTITKEEREIVLAATRALRLNVAGVDLIRSKSGSKILEVNSSPGLEGIEGATGKNIAREIIKHIEKNYKKLSDDS